MLQGPLGPFFADLADVLSGQGHTTHRICFNKGDWHYAKADHVRKFQGEPAQWADWLTGYISQNRIDAICCYGDSRYYHREARAVCGKLGIPLFCFEEGYVRPGFVTLEEGGNNANSKFASRFRTGTLKPAQKPEAAAIPNPFRFQFWFATLYYIVKDWRVRGFSRYQHHRRGNWATEMMAWLVAGYRKNTYSRFVEKDLAAKTIGEVDGSLFVVPLQVAVDAQMIYHSPFDSVDDFIATVIRSFAKHAPSDATLLLKHHPMDRGFNHYGSSIDRLRKGLGCASRVLYAFDVDLERVLAASAGCVTVNSTVGLQALETGIPTLALGNSMIGSAGLTAECELDAFWSAPGQVDPKRVAEFKLELVKHTQIPGSFYRCRYIASQNAAKKIIDTLTTDR